MRFPHSESQGKRRFEGAASRIAVRDALAQMRGADSIDEAEQTRCASRRHAPVQPSPPAPGGWTGGAEPRVGEGSRGTKIYDSSGITVAGSIAGRMMSICR